MDRNLPGQLLKERSCSNPEVHRRSIQDLAIVWRCACHGVNVRPFDPENGLALRHVHKPVLRNREAKTVSLEPSLRAIASEAVRVQVWVGWMPFTEVHCCGAVEAAL